MSLTEGKSHTGPTVVANGDSTHPTNHKFDIKSTSYKWTLCVLENFELSYGSLSVKCKEEVLKKPKKFLMKHFLDLLAAFFVIAPCVISFWRGVWDSAVLFLDAGVFQSNCLISNGFCFTLGVFGTQLVMWSQHWVKKNLAGAHSPKSSPARFYFVSRMFSVFWGFCDVYLWKGVWDGLNCTAGMNTTEATAALIIGTFVLVFSKTFRSVLSLPVGIVIDDTKANCCAAQTYLDLQSSAPIRKRFMDLLVSSLLEICVILHWHGIWTLMDLVAKDLDHSHEITGWISWGCGGLAFLIFWIIQFPFALFCKKKEVSMFAKLFANFGITLLGSLATIGTFRGYWYLFDEYLLPDHYELSLINGGIYGAILLYALHCGSSMHAGIMRDISQGTIMEICYTTYFFIKRLDKNFLRLFGNATECPVCHHQHKDLDLPLLVVTQSPTQIIPDELVNDHIDQGKLGEDLFSDSDSDEERSIRENGLEFNV